MKLDVIVPMFNIQEDINEYIINWWQEIPINRLILGLGKKTDKDLDSFFIDIFYQDQKHTLGMCLAELMKQVKTEWFVYLHSDVKIAEFNFQIMKNYMNPEVGAIEGSPLLIRGGKRTLLGRHWLERAYSGFQVFRTEAVQYIIHKIEDDYIFRNEDLIFQNAVIDMGFTYEKAISTYFHINEGGYKKNEKDSREQFLGLIKYAQPTELMKSIMRITINHYHRTYDNITSENILKFALKNNPKWVNELQDSQYIKR